MSSSFNLPPGPSAPAALQTLAWIRRPTDVLTRCATRFGTPFTLRHLCKPPMIVVSDPTHVRAVFRDSRDVYLTGQASQGFATFCGRSSIMVLDGEEHRRHRHLLMPAFHGDRMAHFGSLIGRSTELDLAQWYGRVSLLERMRRITLDVIFRAVFGVSRAQELEDLSSLMGTLLTRVSSVLMYLRAARVDLGRYSPWGRFRRARREFKRILLEEIRRARHDVSERHDVLASIIREGEHRGDELTEQEIADELMTLLAVGHETTTVALAWAFQWILADSVVHERLRQEIRSLGERPIPSELATIPYLHAVAQESLRLSPPIMLILRCLTRDTCVGGYEVPSGWLVRPSPYLTHRRPDLYPDPECFDPGRCQSGRPSSFEYYPFGGGSRTCLGLSFAVYQMKVIIGTVLAHADLTLDAPATHDIVRMKLLIAPARGTPVRVRSTFGLVPLSGGRR